MRFGEIPTDTIEDILKRATFSYGGTTCGAVNLLKSGIDIRDYTSVTVEFASVSDYEIFKNSLTTEWDLEEYKDKVIELFDINMSARDIFMFFVYPIQEVMFAHVTNTRNLPSMLSNGDNIQQSQTLLLKEDKEFYGDFGRGVYLINIEDEDALQNLCEYFIDVNHIDLVVIGGYYSNHYTENKMYLCENNVSHKGYVVHKGDLILEDFIIEKCEDDLYTTLKQVQKKMISMRRIS